jgi:hypothetical protein
MSSEHSSQNDAGTSGPGLLDGKRNDQLHGTANRRNNMWLLREKVLKTRPDLLGDARWPCAIWH